MEAEVAKVVRGTKAGRAGGNLVMHAEDLKGWLWEHLSGRDQ